MKIAMLSDVYFPRVNGVSTSIATFRRELEALGHTVHVIAPDYPTAKPEVGIRRMPSRYVFADPEDRMMQRHALLELTAELAEQEYDILHIQTPFVAHHAGVRLARRLGIPRVETYHTFFEEYLYHYLPILPKSLARFIARRFSALQCNDLDGLVVPSEAMAERLRAYGVHTPVSVIPTGIDPENFLGGDGQVFRSRLDIGADQPTLVHVGRIAHEKNIGFLLQVLDRVRRELPQVVLIIAGDGPAVPHLKRLSRRLGLSAHIRFVGYLDRERELLDCYRAGDAFVFASRTETQGLVLLEALALGVPVVSTAVMGTRDVLKPNCGALIAEDDLEDFSTKVLRLLRDPGLRERLAAEGPAYARGWSARAQAERLADFYRSLVHAGPSTYPATGRTGSALKI
jgi:1,2-diacylglycerol 3-alpha-glucosyltransferase